MPQSYSSAVVSASLDQVWSVVREFGGLPSWHPVIESCAFDSGAEGEVGAVRRLTTGDGGVIVERLLALDDEHHQLKYTILESPFPVRRYVSTMRVAPVTDSGDTFIEWSAEFDCDAGDEATMTTTFADGVFGTGLTALRERLGS